MASGDLQGQRFPKGGGSPGRQNCCQANQRPRVCKKCGGHHHTMLSPRGKSSSRKKRSSAGSTSPLRRAAKSRPACSWGGQDSGGDEAEAGSAWVSC